MLRFQGITDDPKQKHTLVLPSGKRLEVRLEFKPLQLGWFISFSYQTFEVRNLRIVNHPNMVHQFKNLIPFGIGCFSKDLREPMLLSDFLNDDLKLYILERAEVLEFEDVLNGQVSA